MRKKIIVNKEAVNVEDVKEKTSNNDANSKVSKTTKTSATKKEKTKSKIKTEAEMGKAEVLEIKDKKIDKSDKKNLKIEKNEDEEKGESSMKKVGSKRNSRSTKAKSTTQKAKKTSTKGGVKTKVKDIAVKEIDEKELFLKGLNYSAYEFMGAHLKTEKKVKGVRFTTWAPNAKSICVVGEFSNWEVEEKFKLENIEHNGIWTAFIEGLDENTLYKYAVESQDGVVTLKSDPYSVRGELRPNTASIVYKPKYRWRDKKWRESVKKTEVTQAPINIYEVHLGSWKRKENGDFYSYKELAEMLPEYVKKLGYTHVELLPVMEHPLDDSWGYQVTGFYAPTSRYGKGEDFKLLIDEFHKNDIGVILDWVPGHFCKDNHGLYKFDGTNTYEYQSNLNAENLGWGTCNFDLGRPEVKSFLISNAIYWLKEFHIDGLRVDAVANMLYLDFSKEYGEWEANKFGGNENLEAIEFFKQMNSAVFKEFPKALMIAEESTAWPMVTKPAEEGGLGFNFKWNMGWMNDTLEYIKIDPIFRKEIHNKMNFAMMYHYSENYVLAISHDEVVHGKKSLLDKQWGDYWNKFAGVRNYMAYMMGHPGKKTVFMGSELGQFVEWKDKEQLDWNLIEEYDMHKSTYRFFKDLNELYKEHECLWKYDYEYKGFKWIDADNRDKSIFSFMRMTDDPKETLIFVCNFTPVVYYDFEIGVPYKGEYEEIFNTDSEYYGGSNQIMQDNLFTNEVPANNLPVSLKIKVPPMATTIIKPKNVEIPVIEADLETEEIKNKEIENTEKVK